MIDLKQFLQETGVKSKAGLAKRLDTTRQNLHNLISNCSERLLKDLDHAFPEYLATYEESKLIFHHSTTNQMPDLHRATREELLLALSSYPAVYAAIALSKEEELEYFFESVANKWVCFSKVGTDETFMKFSRAACEGFAVGMESIRK